MIGNAVKLAGGPGSGVEQNNAKEIPILESSPLVSIGHRERFMENHKPVKRCVEVPTKNIKYKGQEKYVPKKLKKMIKIWDEVSDKPVDLIKDSKGDYHILDGHHRALAALVKKVPSMKANVYRPPLVKEGSGDNKFLSQLIFKLIGAARRKKSKPRKKRRRRK